MSDYLDPHTVCGTFCEEGKCPGYKPKVFEAAFDTPKTPEQAVAVLKAWGSGTCMTYSDERAKEAYKMLQPVLKLVGELLDSNASFYASAIERDRPGLIEFDVWEQKMRKAMEGIK